MSQAEADGDDWRGTDEGGKLKATGTTHWNSPNTGATNESGFSALPGGFRATGMFYEIGNKASFWSYMENNPAYSKSRALEYRYTTIHRYHQGSNDGRSVRCVRDLPADIDGDGVGDEDDNCPDVYNVDQDDLDGDGEGNICDDDTDGDGIITSRDTCPQIYNPDQADLDRDGIGDACDSDIGGYG